MTISLYFEPMTAQVGLISLGLVLSLSGTVQDAGKESEMTEFVLGLVLICAWVCGFGIGFGIEKDEMTQTNWDDLIEEVEFRKGELSCAVWSGEQTLK
jgi:hypothetical protein